MSKVLIPAEGISEWIFYRTPCGGFIFGFVKSDYYFSSYLEYYYFVSLSNLPIPSLWRVYGFIIKCTSL